MGNKMAAQTSPKAKNLSARLAAVQGVYQSIHNGQPLAAVFEEYQLYRNPPPVDDGEEKLVQPDGSLLKGVLLGIQERREDLETMIKANLSNQDKVIEPLLHSILLCGTWELLANQEVDAPIIINDYLNVTHSFYEHGEVSLVNAILDTIAKTARI
jgi:transcription antitermination protein NusB